MPLTAIEYGQLAWHQMARSSRSAAYTLKRMQALGTHEYDVLLLYIEYCEQHIPSESEYVRTSSQETWRTARKLFATMIIKDCEGLLSASASEIFTSIINKAARKLWRIGQLSWSAQLDDFLTDAHVQHFREWLATSLLAAGLVTMAFSVHTNLPDPIWVPGIITSAILLTLWVLVDELFSRPWN